MSIQTNFPAISPTLNLSFALTKALDPRVTFSRASTGTFYGTQTAKAEENLFIWSQEFNLTNWPVGANITYTENTGETTAPDGTSTADKITAISGASILSRAIQSVTNSNQVVFSVFAKKGTHNFIQLLTNAVGSGFVNFNLDAGTFSATTATGSITSVGNDWYRCVAVMPASTPTNFQISIAPSASAIRAELWSPVGTEALYIWGAQLEQRSTATAYTPTTTQRITNYIPVLQTAASGVARFDHNPITDESLGLLIEELRSNLVLRSEEFDNASWVKTEASIDANIIVAPNGTLTGGAIVDTTASATHNCTQTISGLVGNTAYTASCYMKKGSKNFGSIAFGPNASWGSGTGASVFFDLVNGTASSQLNATGTIQSVGNGWYRCTATSTTIASPGAATSINIRPSLTGSAAAYTGDSTQAIYIWGAQLEAGAFATSYIQTVASQVTRAADAASMTGTNFSSWYNQAEGTLYADAAYVGLTASRAIVSINDNTSNNLIQIQTSPSTVTTSRFFVTFNNTTQAAIGAASVFAAGSFGRHAAAYKPNDFAFTSNGATVLTATNGILPSALQLQIGAWITVFSNVHIRKIAYYPIRCTNAQLQGLTS